MKNFRNSVRRFKGGSSGPTETTVTQSNIPEEVMPEFKGLLARSEFESNQPYLPYPQARLAGFSPAERMAQRGLGAMAMYGSPRETRQASQYLQNLPSSMSSDISEAYMSPYFSQALDPSKTEAIRQSAIQARGIRDTAATSGGLGGYREAIMQSNRQRDLNRQLTDMEYGGRQDAFMDASRRFEADRASRMGQIQGLAGLGLQQEQSATGRLQGLQNIGEQQRALQQASMDIGYQDFLRQQGYPQQQLGFYENILKGTYSKPDQTVSTYQQRPGIFAGLAGLGLNLAGIGKMMG